MAGLITPSPGASGFVAACANNWWPRAARRCGTADPRGRRRRRAGPRSEAIGVAVEGSEQASWPVALNGAVNGANSAARKMPASGSSAVERNVPRRGGGSVMVGVSQEIVGVQYSATRRVAGRSLLHASAYPGPVRPRRGSASACVSGSTSPGSIARRSRKLHLGELGRDADDPDREEARHPAGVLERSISTGSTWWPSDSRSRAACATAATQSGCDSAMEPSGMSRRVAKPILSERAAARRSRRRSARAAAARRTDRRAARPRADRARRRVAARSREDVLVDEAAVDVAVIGRERDPAARWLHAEQAAAARRDADRAAAVVAVRDRHHAARDGGRGAAARAAGGAPQIVGVAARRPRGRLRRREDAELRRVGLADDDEAGAAERGDEVAVVRHAVPVALEGQEARGVERAADRGADVLDEDRHAAERAVRRILGLGSGLLVERHDDGAELVVVALAPRDRGVDELERVRRGRT